MRGLREVSCGIRSQNFLLLLFLDVPLYIIEFIKLISFSRYCEMYTRQNKVNNCITFLFRLLLKSKTTLRAKRFKLDCQMTIISILKSYYL